MHLPPPLVVVCVGTDHHPFDRVVGWVDRWAASDTGRSARVVIQHGTASPPDHAEGRELIPHAELSDLFSLAAAVVSHGGPSTVMDARMVGSVPIVVPRNPAHGEHVDDHQMRFGRHLDKHGLATLASSERELHDLLDGAVADPERHRLEVGPEKLSPGVLRFATLVDHLLQVRSVDGSRIVELERPGGAS